MSHLRNPLEAKLAMRGGKPTLFINGQPQVPIFYSLTDVPGGRWSWEEVPQRNIRLFYEHGIRLVQLDIFLDHIWSEDGRMDLGLAQRQIQGVLEHCPEAAVVFRLHVSSPKWWIQLHPEEWTYYADTSPQSDLPWGLNRLIEEDNGPATRVSLASEVWQREGERVVGEFCRQFSQTAEGDALVGIQVANGVYGEWHYWGFIDHDPDTGHAMTKRFRKWLRDRYGSDEALRQEWGRESVTLENAEVPGGEERNTTSSGLFRDPAHEQNVIDYYRCQHEVLADSIIGFSKVVKDNWPRPIITGTFYGYFFFMFGRQAAGGHLELPRVLASPYVDYLSGPSVYDPEANATGEPYRSRSLISSCQLAGKLWLDEMDKRPDLADGDNNLANIRRNMLYTYTKGGQGLWFYDFGPSGFISQAGQVHGWWDHPDYLNEIRGVHELLKRYGKRDYENLADVLLVYDTRCYYYLASQLQEDITHFIEGWMPLGLFRSGAAFDIIHFDDLFRVDLDRYKAIVMANTLVIDDATRRRIHEKVAVNGRHVIWVYAPGYCDGRKLGSELVEETTGFQHLVRHQLPGEAKVTIPALAEEPLEYKSWDKILDPLFAVADDEARQLGFYAGEEACALACKRLGDSMSWFMALPTDSPAVWRAILQDAGVHFYTSQCGDIIYAGGGLVVLHTKIAGQRSLRLHNGKEVCVTIGKEGETIIIDAETGDVL